MEERGRKLEDAISALIDFIKSFGRTFYSVSLHPRATFRVLNEPHSESGRYVNPAAFWLTNTAVAIAIQSIIDGRRIDITNALGVSSTLLDALAGGLLISCYLWMIFDLRTKQNYMRVLRVEFLTSFLFIPVCIASRLFKPLYDSVGTRFNSWAIGESEMVEILWLALIIMLVISVTVVWCIYFGIGLRSVFGKSRTSLFLAILSARVLWILLFVAVLWIFGEFRLLASFRTTILGKREIAMALSKSPRDYITASAKLDVLKSEGLFNSRDMRIWSMICSSVVGVGRLNAYKSIPSIEAKITQSIDVIFTGNNQTALITAKRLLDDVTSNSALKGFDSQLQREYKSLTDAERMIKDPNFEPNLKTHAIAFPSLFSPSIFPDVSGEGLKAGS